MRILVTGCYGFIGSHVCRKLLKLGHEVVGIDRLDGAKSPKPAGRLEGLEGMRHVRADLSSEKVIADSIAAAQPDVVVWLAGQYAVAPLTIRLLRRYHESVTGLSFAKWYAAEHGAKHFVYASSTFVDADRNNLSSHAYGWSKQAAEQLAVVRHPKFPTMATTGIRYGSTFGAWCRPDVAMYVLCHKIIRGQLHEIKPGSGFHYRVNFLDVRDAVDATVAIACHTPVQQDNWLTVVADDVPQDMGEMVRRMENSLVKKARIDWSNYREPGPDAPTPTAVLDQLEAATGFRPKIKLTEAVWSFAQWMDYAHRKGTL